MKARAVIKFCLPYFCLVVLLFCWWLIRDRTRVLGRKKFDYSDGSSIELVFKGIDIDPATQPHRHKFATTNPQ